MGWALKLTVVGLFLLWMTSFFVGFFTMERFPVKLATVLYEVGTTWLIAFLYLLIAFMVIDIATLCHLLPKDIFKDSAVGLLSMVGLIAILLVGGAFQYHHKYREELTLETDKKIEKPLTIFMASDLHIGYHTYLSIVSLLPDLHRCQTEMLFYISAEEGVVGESKPVADLLDTIVCLLKIVADVFQHVFRYPFVGGFA